MGADRRNARRSRTRLCAAPRGGTRRGSRALDGSDLRSESPAGRRSGVVGDAASPGGGRGARGSAPTSLLDQDLPRVGAGEHGRPDLRSGTAAVRCLHPAALRIHRGADRGLGAPGDAGVRLGLHHQFGMGSGGRRVRCASVSLRHRRFVAAGAAARLAACLSDSRFF